MVFFLSIALLFNFSYLVLVILMSFLLFLFIKNYHKFKLKNRETCFTVIQTIIE